MKYRIETRKTLITDNNRKFVIGEDIAFKVYNVRTGRCDEYIGVISKIGKRSIVISHMEINNIRVDGYRKIYLKNIMKDSCNYVEV